MLVILKIPVVYLCAVVWWAIRAEPPRPFEAAAVRSSLDPPPTCDWCRRHGPRRLGPRGGHGGRLVRNRRGATAQVRLRRTVSA